MTGRRAYHRAMTDRPGGTKPQAPEVPVPKVGCRPPPVAPRGTLTFDDSAPKSRLMSDIAAPWIVCEDLAGLRAQALGLAEAAGLTPESAN